MKKIVSMGVAVLVLGFPMFVLAQGSTTGPFADIGKFFAQFTTLINSTLVPLVFAIAFLAFLWGATKYFIMGGADEGKRDEGKQLMLYSVIAFVLMVAIWGIVNLIAGGLFKTDDKIKIPNVPGMNQSGGNPA